MPARLKVSGRSRPPPSRPPGTPRCLRLRNQQKGNSKAAGKPTGSEAACRLLPSRPRGLGKALVSRVKTPFPCFLVLETGRPPPWGQLSGKGRGAGDMGAGEVVGLGSLATRRRFPCEFSPWICGDARLRWTAVVWPPRAEVEAPGRAVRGAEHLPRRTEGAPATSPDLRGRPPASSGPCKLTHCRPSHCTEEQTEAQEAENLPAHSPPAPPGASVTRSPHPCPPPPVSPAGTRGAKPSPHGC